MTIPRVVLASVVAAAAVLLSASPRGAAPRFHSDDPLQREPETQDASAVQEWEIDLFWDLAENLFTRPGDKTENVRAQNVNTADEVPDSSWFTNRILARPLSIDEAARGPLTGEGPAPGPYSVVRDKRSGYAPGFQMRDAKGVLWFVSFDAPGQPEAATGAILVANKIFWALGYWQVENYLVQIRPEQLAVADSAKMMPPSGKERRMKPGDVEDVLRRAHRSADGSYRAVAARALTGKPLGGFRYHGTRPDDPNDVVPHEHRRELRALKVFGAWTNLVDMKAGNTLDMLVTENGKGIVRHYLQDVGSTFGTGALAPREYEEGWEYLVEGGLTGKRLATLNFYIPSWYRLPYEEHPAIGRFEGAGFVPEDWKPRVPTGAFLRARADDNFWAARRVMAFSDEMIRAIVATGQYSDPAAAKILADTLIQRRDQIGRAYLTSVTPAVTFALDADGTLTFENAAVQARAAGEPPDGYVVDWARFDNGADTATSLGAPVTTATGRAKAPAPLPAEAGAFVKIRIAERRTTPAVPPVEVYFRRGAGGWTLVGVDRQPQP
jgi:hypothetical protein